MTKILSAHQKLATLSSNRPRANGKIRWRDCSRTAGGERKGAKMRRKVPAVVMPMEKKSFSLLVPIQIVFSMD